VRLRGPCGAQFEFTLAAIAQNLQACQVGRPATTTRPCVLCVTLQASVKSSVSRPAQSSGWQRTASTNGISRPAPSVCRLLQQNPSLADGPKSIRLDHYRAAHLAAFSNSIACLKSAMDLTMRPICPVGDTFLYFLADEQNLRRPAG